MTSTTRPCLQWLWVALAAALLSLVVLPQPVAAQGTAAGSRLAAIRERMERGQSLYVGGDPKAAAEVFDSSYEKYKFPAFLFNSGVCYQKLGQNDLALARFGTYLEVNPDAPDAERVKQRIASLQAAASGGTGGASAEAPARAPAGDDAMKSVVLVETEPTGAPVVIYAPRGGGAPKFDLGGANPDWEEVVTAESPCNLTLDVGRYHVVVKKFRDFNPAGQEIEVAAGRVLHFVANLSQGAFMSFLRVSANIRGAYVYLDDPQRERPEWGLTPHAELVAPGSHTILVEAPGFEPYTTRVDVEQGAQRQVEVTLSRVGFGILRIDATAPDVSVKIDGKPVGDWRSGEPPLAVELPAGPKHIEVSSKGRKTFRGVVEVPRGQALPVHVEMIPTFPRGAAWTQAAIGVAFAGTSVWLGVQSNRLHRQLEDDRDAGVLEQDDSRIARGRVFAISADAGFAVAAALGLLATHSFIKDPLPESSHKADRPVEFDDPRKQRPAAATSSRGRVAQERGSGWSSKLALSPSLGLDGAGLSLGGRF